eukprot:Protomagalhaensia_sp_Gyna_25__656@NODE_1306_length_1958_cov_39_460135_g1042_i0_p1_GENE_NODE_1306_length_1958_cov_39_460135_g1042_i0NODE_1306_length_1958_cov_39_460135_g1042_i0_p1_ORF_typecomplete_len555_score71_40GCS/PF03074_16/1e125GCS2/PF04107_13/0_00031_NODE_1306_length_1958_cov_39_460135_g1042_i0831666
MGQCCLQVTFGCPDMKFARHLYDQMAVLAPIFLALSAGTPILRGLMAATDTRWRVLEQGCDCRTDEELKFLDQSRYGAVPMYIGTGPYMKQHASELNDIDTPINEEAYAMLRAAQMDEVLARHFAHMWIRDPLVIFSDRVELDNTTHVDHFENVQSTNWNSVRFKPPPVSLDGKTRPKIGWRVELRTPDLQISDFENAVMACFAQLLSLAILKENWQFYIPISQSRANMTTAHKRDAVIKELFYFRRNIYGDSYNATHTCGDESTTRSGGSTEASLSPSSGSDIQADKGCVAEDVCRMTLREIFLGSNRSSFQGLIPLLDRFVSNEWRNHRCSRAAVEKYRIYANYIRQKVLGQVWSDAKVIRHIVRSSPLYEGDSVIGSELNYEINKFAVMAGFGLCREISPWYQSGCLPTGRISRRQIPSQTGRQILEVLARSESIFLAALVRFPVEGDLTLADKLGATLISDGDSDCLGYDSEKASDDDAAELHPTCRESNASSHTHLLERKLVTPPLTDFDPSLFLEINKHSR